MSDPRPRLTRRLRRAQVGIVAASVGSLLVVLVVGAALVLGLYRGDLVDQVDGQLEDAAAVVELASESITVPADGVVEAPVQVITPDGRLLYASSPLRGDEALWRPGDPTGPHTVASEAVGPARIVVTPFRGQHLVLAEPLRPIDAAVRSLRTTMLLALPLLTAALALVIWAAVGRALRPVATAGEREERLLADISHEIRSPLAGMRVLLETEPADPGGARLSRVDALASLRRLETVTDQLLSLTREGPEASVPARPVDLDEVVERTIRRLGPGADRRIDATGVRAGQVIGSEDDLESLVENLLANALRHASTVVRVSLVEGRGLTTLTVDDDGPGVPPEARADVFERFTRLDEARARDAGGAGLGLAIVRAVAEGHGGSVTVSASRLGGAAFVVVLPASTVAQP